MVRIALIGTSHLVAVQEASLGMRSELDAAGISLTFQPVGHDGEDFSIVDGRVSTSFRSRRLRSQVEASGLSEGLVVGDQDAFVLIGGYGFALALRTYNHCRAEAHSNPGEKLTLVSDACFETALAGRIRETPMPSVARTLANAVPSAPIALVTTPFYNARVEETADLGPRYRALRASGDAAELAASWRRAVRRAVGDRFTVIDQPQDTLETPVLTRPIFGMPPRHVAGKADPVIDNTHMNATYGEKILRLCLAWAKGAVQSRH